MVHKNTEILIGEGEGVNVLPRGGETCFLPRFKIPKQENGVYQEVCSADQEVDHKLWQ